MLPSASCTPMKEATSAQEQLTCKTIAMVPTTVPVSALKTSATEFLPAFVPITTLMMRGIPCSCTQERLLQILDELGFQGQYDFFYLPRKTQQSNLGYAFVNFLDMEWASLCHLALNGRALDAMRSKKVLSVCPAHIQGLKNLKKHFRNTCVARNSDRGPVFPKTVARRQQSFPQEFPQVSSWPAVAA